MDKREQLVEQAFRLFYRQGVYAVGINKVLDESGIAKKTLYNHFASKEALVAATVSYRDSLFRQWLFGRMDAVAAGKPALMEAFMALDDWFNGRVAVMPEFHGCYFINVSAEFSDLKHPIHQQCAEHKQAILEKIREQVVLAGGDESVANHVALLKEGAIVQAYVGGDLQSALKARRLLDQLL